MEEVKTRGKRGGVQWCSDSDGEWQHLGHRAQFRQSGRPSPIAPLTCFPVNSSPLSTDNLKVSASALSHELLQLAFTRQRRVNHCVQWDPLLNNPVQGPRKQNLRSSDWQSQPFNAQVPPPPPLDPPPYLNAPGGLTGHQQVIWAGRGSGTESRCPV